MTPTESGNGRTLAQGNRATPGAWGLDPLSIPGRSRRIAPCSPFTPLPWSLMIFVDFPNRAVADASVRSASRQGTWARRRASHSAMSRTAFARRARPRTSGVPRRSPATATRSSGANPALVATTRAREPVRPTGPRASLGSTWSRGLRPNPRHPRSAPKMEKPNNVSVVGPHWLPG